MNSKGQEFDAILNAVAKGESDANAELFSMVYDELYRLAANYMSRERPDHTLQPTALVNEAFLSLSKQTPADGKRSAADVAANPQFTNVDHFVATAAIVMRRILVNHAKAKKTQKRGGNKQPMQLSIDVSEAFDDSAIDLIALDDALTILKTIDENQHRIVELKFFGGMTTKQCAEFLGISERSAYYEWSHARAWLKNQIEGGLS